ncbi:hypothetical protein QYF36_015850 [Acer negundo]|nr:hypothetical protein QYF36_015850 [Acer negundo]
MAVFPLKVVAGIDWPKNSFRSLLSSLRVVLGTPADCVSLALFGALFSWSTPILVISGINKGSSCGQKMFYSGAFAGAREALISGVPSLRISLNWKKDVSCETDLKDAANVCLPLIYAAVNDIEKGNFPKGCLLNVDIPSCPLTNKGNGHLHVLMSYESVLALGLLLMKFIFFAAACYESNIEALVVYEVRKIMEVSKRKFFLGGSMV